MGIEAAYLDIVAGFETSPSVCEIFEIKLGSIFSMKVQILRLSESFMLVKLASEINVSFID